jgi:hypothetical protein
MTLEQREARRRAVDAYRIINAHAEGYFRSPVDVREDELHPLAVARLRYVRARAKRVLGKRIQARGSASRRRRAKANR